MFVDFVTYDYIQSAVKPDVILSKIYTYGHTNAKSLHIPMRLQVVLFTILVLHLRAILPPPLPLLVPQ